MKKIILLCSQGLSTSLLVEHMKEEASAMGFACQIDAYPLADVDEVKGDADAILLGPQVRFRQAQVQAKCPGIPVETIDQVAYGTMDGKKVLKKARKLMGITE